MLQMPDGLTDEALLQRIATHDHPAFAVLVRRHSNRFYALAYRSVFNKEEAEDIVQEAFLKLWHKPSLWNPRRNATFTTWFYRVVVNLCIDHIKRKKPVALSEDLELADSRPDAHAEFAQKALINEVDHAIYQLPERQRTALNLCFYEGLSNAEAAEIMGVKVKALESLLMRAKAHLRESLKHMKGEVYAAAG